MYRKTPVRTLLIMLMLAITLVSTTACTKTTNNSDDGALIIADMSGHEVTIPPNIERIYAADAGSMIFVYTIAPQTLVGLPYAFNDVEKDFILPEYQDLPVLGMNSQVNYEAVIAQNPQLAIMSGTADEATIEKAISLEEQLGIPVVVIDLDLFASPAAYTLMGQIIGDEKRGNDLSQYAQKTLDSIVDIPESEQVTVYYANGIDSLNTSARNTAASQLFDIIGAINVCDLESETGDRLQVTKEHLLSWDADYIFVNGEPKENVSGQSAAQDICNNPDYANLAAVKSGNVISIPKAPFAWVDRPRSENRLIGILWLGSIMYPEYYDFDETDIKEFYKLFYHMDLTDEQVTDLLNQ